MIHELVASAGITAGAGVVTEATAGQVKTATIATAAAAGTLIGTAVTTARVPSEASCPGASVTVGGGVNVAGDTLAFGCWFQLLSDRWLRAVPPSVFSAQTGQRRHPRHPLTREARE